MGECSSRRESNLAAREKRNMLLSNRYKFSQLESKTGKNRIDHVRRFVHH